MIVEATIRTPRGKCGIRITDDDTVESVIAWARRAVGVRADTSDVEELYAGGIRLDTIEAVRAAARRGPIELVATGSGV